MRLGRKQWKWLAYAVSNGNQVRAKRPEHRQVVDRLVALGLMASEGEQLFSVTQAGVTMLRERIEERSLSSLL
jgi:hypothetical protein